MLWIVKKVNYYYYTKLVIRLKIILEDKRTNLCKISKLRNLPFQQFVLSSLTHVFT